jgi:hypothetical protein
LRKVACRGIDAERTAGFGGMGEQGVHLAGGPTAGGNYGTQPFAST